MISTKIGVLLDATGSMAGDRHRTIDGFNEYLRGLKEDTNTREAMISVAKFNSGEGFQVLRREVSVADTEPLAESEYNCNYVTPLFDAATQLIGLLERGAQADRIIVVIMTDGMENASQETDFKTLNALIDEKRKRGNWTFVFLGADLDAWAAQSAMGVQFASASNTMSYNKDQSRAAYGLVAQATNHLVGSSMCSTDQFFTPDPSVANVALTPNEAASTLGVSTSMLAKMRQSKTGPAYTKVGHKTVRYARRDIDDWIAARKVTTTN